MESIIERLLEIGYEMAGHTRQETVRMPDPDGAPIGNRGRSGGKTAIFGGRIKMQCGIDQFVTIGPRTAFFWRKDGAFMADQVKLSVRHESDKIEQEAARRAGLVELDQTKKHPLYKPYRGNFYIV